MSTIAKLQIAGVIFALGTLPAIMVARPDATGNQPDSYILGPEDLLSIRVLELEEFSSQNFPPIRIDVRGDIRLPIIGRIHASGMTAQQLEAEISTRLLKVVNEPDVTVGVLESKSHPVSVLGAVKNPGVYQITGKKTLFEVLSLAGGLSQDAGNTVNITRRTTMGMLPLPEVRRDPSEQFYVGQINLRSVMDAKDPSVNIDILSGDVISAPRAELVYVVGAVKRPGGFVLNEKENISVMQAVSLAEGLDNFAAKKRVRILRPNKAGGDRTQIAVNLERILSGQDGDMPLHANDILFIPSSESKRVAAKGLETAIQVAAGVAIYRF